MSRNALSIKRIVTLVLSLVTLTSLFRMQCMTKIMTPCRVVKMQKSHSTTWE